MGDNLIKLYISLHEVYLVIRVALKTIDYNWDVQWPVTGQTAALTIPLSPFFQVDLG